MGAIDMLAGLHTGWDAVECGYSAHRTSDSVLFLKTLFKPALIQVNDWFVAAWNQSVVEYRLRQRGMNAMEAAFEAKPVGVEELRMAYALMLLTTPGIAFSEFKKWAVNVKQSRLGGIFDRRGYIHLLFRSRVEERVGHSKRFVVTDLVLSDALSGTMTRHMLDSLMQAARAEGCDHMTVEAPSDRRNGKNLLKILENIGFIDESVLMAARL